MQKYHFGLLLSFVFLLSISFSPTFGFTVEIPQGTSTEGCVDMDLCFIPPSITSFETVLITWKNNDSVAHTVTSGSEAGGSSGEFDSKLILPGDTFARYFNSMGQFDYFCTVHPWMVGTVNIIEDGDGISYISVTNTPKEIHAGEEIMFDAYDSYDDDGDILNYEWEFIGKNSDYYYYDTGTMIKYTPPSPGNYEVFLTLTTDYGLVDWDYTTIKVLPKLSDPNLKSESTSTITEHYGTFAGKITSVVIDYPSEIHAGEPINFDASGTFDDEGEITEYHWWFYSDGETDTYNYDMRYGKSFEYIFSSPGTMMVEWEFVTDYEKYEGGSFVINVLPTSNEQSVPVPDYDPNESSGVQIPDPDPLACGPGTQLINGQCEKIRKTPGPDLTLIIVGIIIAAVAAGAGIAISRSRKSSSSKTTTDTTSDSKGSGKGPKCNVCGTIIPEGKNVCPNCGDTYSV